MTTPGHDSTREPSRPLPGRLSAPATRALTAAGHDSLNSLASASRTRLRGLHGVGPQALRILDEELAALGLSLGS